MTDKLSPETLALMDKLEKALTICTEEDVDPTSCEGCPYEGAGYMCTQQEADGLALIRRIRKELGLSGGGA